MHAAADVLMSWAFPCMKKVQEICVYAQKTALEPHLGYSATVIAIPILRMKGKQACTAAYSKEA